MPCDLLCIFRVAQLTAAWSLTMQPNNELVRAFASGCANMPTITRREEEIYFSSKRCRSRHGRQRRAPSGEAEHASLLRLNTTMNFLQRVRNRERTRSVLATRASFAFPAARIPEALRNHDDS